VKILWNIVLTMVCAIIVSAIMMAFLPICTALYPMPSGVTPNDQEKFNAYVAGLPPAAHALVLFSHFIGPFIGCLLAARFAAYRSIIPAVIIGVLFLAGGIANWVMLGLGPMFALLEFPLYPMAAYLGIWLGRPKLQAVEVKAVGKP
jgi:hypothetical protein